MLKAWSKHHHDLGRNRTQIACRLHAALCELISGISKKITARLTQPPRGSRPAAQSSSEQAADTGSTRPPLVIAVIVGFHALKLIRKITVTLRSA